jgi:hypothetical protein
VLDIEVFETDMPNRIWMIAKNLLDCYPLPPYDAHQSDHPKARQQRFNVCMDEPVDYGELAACLSRSRGLPSVGVRTPYRSTWLDKQQTQVPARLAATLRRRGDGRSGLELPARRRRPAHRLVPRLMLTVGRARSETSRSQATVRRGAGRVQGA